MCFCPAYNDIVIPVTAFVSLESARSFLKETFGGEWLDKSHGKIELYRYDISENDDLEKIFSRVNTGCCEPSRLLLLKIEDGQLRLFPFDLD